MADRREGTNQRGRERASDSAGTKAVKDAEARAVKSVKEAEARATKSLREAEARASESIKESEARAAEAIRKAEARAAKAAEVEEERLARAAEAVMKAAERADRFAGAATDAAGRAERSAGAATDAAEAADGARERLDAAWADRAMDLAEREVVEGARAGDLALRQAKAASALAMAAGQREVMRGMGAATAATSSVNLPKLDPYRDNPGARKSR